MTHARGSILKQLSSLLALAVVGAMGPAASAQTVYPKVYYNGDSRGYTGEGDWAVGQYKGQCNAGDSARGISVIDNDSASWGWNTDLLPHGMLCSGGHEYYVANTSDINGSNIEYPYSLGFSARGDYGTGTWDSGAHIALTECARDEAVIGISETSDGQHLPGHLLCAWISSELWTDYSRCYTLAFSSTYDVRTSGSGGDWDVNTSKNQCRDSEILKGVSTDTWTGRLSRILCCGVEPHPH